MTPRPDRHPDRPQHPEPLHNQVKTRSDPPGDHPIVPIAVWRLDGRDDQPAADQESTFGSRLARQLVLIYTSRGDTVIDLDNNPHLRAATDATGRGYLALTDPTDIATLDDLHTTDRPVNLITMQWPRDRHDNATPPTAPAAAADLFLACRLIVGDTAAVIAAVRPTTVTGTFAAHEQTLRTAADAAGLVHLLQIIAVSSPSGSDAFLYYATTAEVAHATATRTALHIDLLAYTPRTTAVAPSADVTR